MKKRQLRLGHRDPGTRDWLYLKFESKQQLRSVYRAPQKAIITEGEKRYLFDRSALKRERKTHRCHLCLGDIKTNNTTCIIKTLCLIFLTLSSVVFRLDMCIYIFMKHDNNIEEIQQLQTQ